VAGSIVFASLADRFEGDPVDTSDVLDRIRGILSDPIYAEEHPTLLQRLLGPTYSWLQKMIAWVIDKLIDAALTAFRLLSTDFLSIAGPILVILIAGLGIGLLARRRAREIERRATIERILELGRDPAELEAKAVEADEVGDHAEAIRLRFVAGLLRLDQEGAIEFYPGLSNGAIADQLQDPTFDQLASQFDGVVYGRRATDRHASRRAAEDWARLQGARR